MVRLMLDARAMPADGEAVDRLFEELIRDGGYYWGEELVDELRRGPCSKRWEFICKVHGLETSHQGAGESSDNVGGTLNGPVDAGGQAEADEEISGILQKLESVKDTVLASESDGETVLRFLYNLEKLLRQSRLREVFVYYDYVTALLEPLVTVILDLEQMHGHNSKFLYIHLRCIKTIMNSSEGRLLVLKNDVLVTYLRDIVTTDLEFSINFVKNKCQAMEVLLLLSYLDMDRGFQVIYETFEPYMDEWMDSTLCNCDELQHYESSSSLINPTKILVEYCTLFMFMVNSIIEGYQSFEKKTAIIASFENVEKFTPLITLIENLDDENTSTQIKKYRDVKLEIMTRNSCVPSILEDVSYSQVLTDLVIQTKNTALESGLGNLFTLVFQVIHTKKLNESIKFLKLIALLVPYLNKVLTVEDSLENPDYFFKDAITTLVDNLQSEDLTRRAMVEIKTLEKNITELNSHIAELENEAHMDKRTIIQQLKQAEHMLEEKTIENESSIRLINQLKGQLREKQKKYDQLLVHQRMAPKDTRSISGGKIFENVNSGKVNQRSFSTSSAKMIYKSKGFRSLVSVVQSNEDFHNQKENVSGYKPGLNMVYNENGKGSSLTTFDTGKGYPQNVFNTGIKSQQGDVEHEQYLLKSAQYSSDISSDIAKQEFNGAASTGKPYILPQNSVMTLNMNTSVDSVVSTEFDQPSIQPEHGNVQIAGLPPPPAPPFLKLGGGSKLSVTSSNDDKDGPTIPDSPIMEFPGILTNIDIKKNEDASTKIGVTNDNLPPPPPPPPLPPNLTKNKASADTSDEASGDVVVAPPPPPPLPSNFNVPSSTPKSTIRLKQIHWEKVDDVGGTLWEDVSGIPLNHLKDEGVFSQIEKYFKILEPVKKTKVLAENENKPTKISFLTRDIAQQFGINLHMYSQLSVEEFVTKVLKCEDDLIQNVSVLGFFTKEDLTQIPSGLERKFAPYSTNYLTDDSPEKDPRELERADHIYLELFYNLRSYWSARSHCLLVLTTYERDYFDLMYKLEKIDEAIQRLYDSTRIKKLLLIIREIGNYMNKGSVTGIKLNSLPKLSFVKSSSEKNISFLHFVERVVRESFPDVYTFTEDIAKVEDLGKVTLEHVELECEEFAEKVGSVVYSLTQGKLSDPTKLHPKDAIFTKMRYKINRAKSKSELLINQHELTKRSLNRLMKYYGEEPMDKESKNNFFNYFVEFAMVFKKCAKENIEREEVTRLYEQRKHLLEQRNKKIEEQEHSDDEINAVDDLITKLRDAKKQHPAPLRRRRNTKAVLNEKRAGEPLLERTQALLSDIQNI